MKQHPLQKGGDRFELSFIGNRGFFVKRNSFKKFNDKNDQEE